MKEKKVILEMRESVFNKLLKLVEYGETHIASSNYNIWATVKIRKV